MASEDHRTIRRLAVAFNERDVEGLVANLDPDAELYPLRAQLEGKACRAQSVSVPLVDGTPGSSGSIETASRSARAKALKQASIMWCAFDP